MADRRRSKGDDAIFFDHEGTACTDEVRHRKCTGRWRGQISLGHDGAGRRVRPKVSGRSKTEVQDKLKARRKELAAGLTSAPPPRYDLRAAAEDFLANGLPGRAQKTVTKNKDAIEPILAVIGGKRIRELAAADVDKALAAMAAKYSTSVVAIGHNALTRTLRRAQARGLVAQNVATLCDTPAGQEGRPSKAMTTAQVAAVLKAAESDPRMYAYICLSIGTTARTEEVRALRWVNVELATEPPFVEVWRSVRATGDTKTEKSRRTLALPRFAADALRTLREDADLTGLVFCTRSGQGLDAANVRREFRRICKAAKVGTDWTPRELRHTGVSLLSLGGLPIEEIARIAGHSSTRTTELVYRRELRPVLTRGAETLDVLLGQAQSSPTK
jgi:integrase